MISLDVHLLKIQQVLKRPGHLKSFRFCQSMILSSLSKDMEKENIDSKNNQKVKLSPITLSSVFANIAFASFRISSLSSLW